MNKLTNENITKLFFKYLLPSVTGTLSVGLLIFIDTIFIGRGVGDFGLAALNIAIPAFTIYTSLGILLGVGGATARAIDLGRGKTHGKCKIFSLSVYLALFVGLIVTLLQLFNLEVFTSMLGASETIFPYAVDYLRILSIFTLFYTIPHTLNSFIRNDNNPNLAMVGLVVCGLVNILLDYIFIFKLNLGMGGAAAATGIAQVIYFFILLTHFTKDSCTLKLEKLSMDFSTVFRIVKVGFPSFVNELAIGGAVFAFNFVLTKIGGDLYLSAYSIVLNINFLIYLVFAGIAQASQPLISVNFGANKLDRVKKSLHLALGSSIFFGIVSYVLLIVFKVSITELFAPGNRELLEVSTKAIPLFYLGTLFMGINIIYSTFFQSIEESFVSTIITFSRGFILIIVGLVLLPRFLGVEGVWFTPVFAELITFIGILIYYYSSKYIRTIRIS